MLTLPNILPGDISGKPVKATPAAADLVLILDVSTSGLKSATVGSLAGDTLPIVDSTAVVKDPVDATKLVRIDAGAITTGTTRVITMRDGDLTLTGGSDGDVLTLQADGSIQLETPAAGGDTLPIVDSTAVVKDPVDATKLVRIDAGAITTGTTRVITMRDGDLTLTGGSDGDVLTLQADGSIALETPAGGSSLPIVDSTAVVKDPVDATKLVRIDAGAITTGTTRVITMRDGDLTLTGGSDGDVLTLQADGSIALETPAGGAVTHWTEANATPITKEITSWSVSSASANVSAVVQPKGTGSLSLNIADGTATGGNDRGSNAVDLQTTRSAATAVASGPEAVAVGSNNTASAASAIALGKSSTASSAYSVAIGQQNTASAVNAVAIGKEVTASGSYATALGYGTVASGVDSFAQGQSSTANADYSSAIGYFASTHGVVGKRAFASGRFAAAGDAQGASYSLRRSTNSDSAAQLTTNASTASTNNQIVLQDDSLITFEALVVGRATSGADQAAYRIFGLAKRGTGAASVALVGSLTIDAIETATGWDCTAVADTTNGALSIQVTGAAATTINWVANARTAEVG